MADDRANDGDDRSHDGDDGVDGVVVEVLGPAARVRLADPRRRNPLGVRTLRRLDDALRMIATRADVRVVVLEAVGPAFSAGHDLKELAACDAEEATALFDACCDLMARLTSLPQPVVAVVDGLATAAGCQLVAACDLAIASERAAFATPGVRIGLFCSTPMVPLSRAVGRKRAMEMLLTGAPIDAHTAAAWGLVNRVVPVEDLDEAVAGLVATIAGWSPHTVALGKATFYEQIDLSEPEAYDRTRRVMAANAVHPVAREGIEAFLAKRDPVWPA
jgi:enoyl-CoA hydratase/carnithine racemase